MNIEQLYRDYNIPFATEGHKHCRPGWVNTECPFCTGNPGLHLGYNTDNDRFVCWRCGGHYPINVISALLNVNKSKAKILMRQYGVLTRKVTEIKRKPRLKSFKLPSNSLNLQRNHRAYLINREFDPDKIIHDWHVLGTGPNALLDKINYKHRIIIPIYWNGEMVSFDSRDITDKAQNKYQACSLIRELIPHKNILYGLQKYWGDTGICVEGPTDVWRFGRGSFATSGIKYTQRQMRLMSKIFKRIFIAYDGEPQALAQAKKLAAELKFRKVEGIIISIKGDPGSMSQKEADYLMNHLLH